jgi:hypothetical protein
MLSVVVFVLLASVAHAAPGALLGTVTLPGNGSCSVAGTFDCTYYMTIKSGCGSPVLQIYLPPVGGNGAAALVSTKTIVDAAGNATTISALAWDPSRGKVWGGYGNSIWLIDIGDPTVSGNAAATFQFNPNVGGITLVDGLAYDPGDDTLYYSPDVNLSVFQFSLGTGVNPPLGTLMNTVTPKNAAGAADGSVSGVAIGSANTLYIGRNGAAEIRRVDKTTGAFIAQFATTAGRVEDLSCDPITYAPLEAILAKDAYSGLYEAFEVEPGTCPCVGCEPVEDPSVRTQGFWKRVCEKPHPSGEHENLPDYVDCVNTKLTFVDVDSVDALCDRLHPDPKNDKCEQAEAQFMALLLNVCSGRVAECNCVVDPALGEVTVGEAIELIDLLLSDPDVRTFEDCVLAQSIADAINNDLTLVDCQ